MKFILKVVPNPYGCDAIFIEINPDSAHKILEYRKAYQSILSNKELLGIHLAGFLDFRLVDVDSIESDLIEQFNEEGQYLEGFSEFPEIPETHRRRIDSPHLVLTKDYIYWKFYEGDCNFPKESDSITWDTIEEITKDI